MSQQTVPSADERLAELESERPFLLRMLSVTIEQLLRATGGDQVVVSEASLTSARALTAWRATDSTDYVLTVAP